MRSRSANWSRGNPAGYRSAELRIEIRSPWSAKARTWFFKAQIQRADGDYDGALESLETVRSKYPRDRVALNQIARILFLKREYVRALAALKEVSSVDPEDVQMHYTRMLCYRGLEDAKGAARE